MTVAINGFTIYAWDHGGYALNIAEYICPLCDPNPPQVNPESEIDISDVTARSLRIPERAEFSSLQRQDSNLLPIIQFLENSAFPEDRPGLAKSIAVAAVKSVK